MRKSSWIKYIFILTLVFTFVSCSVRRKAKKVDCISMKSNDLLKRIHRNTKDFDWYSSKIDVKLILPNDNKQDFKASIRIRKDSAIWSSIKVMSIPVALTLISQDSVKALIKQPKKQYLGADIDYLKKRFNIDADYFVLEDILSGRPLLLNDGSDYVALCIDNELWLMTHTQKEEEKVLKKRQGDEKYIVKYRINKETFVIEKIDALKIIDGTRLIVNYNQFENIEEQLIPTKTEAYFYGVKDTVQLNFSSSKIKLDKPTSMPFNVTDSYETIILE